MDTIYKRAIDFDTFKEQHYPTLDTLDASYKNSWNYVSFMKSPIINHQILYECRQGEDFSGIPKEIFFHMLKNTTFTHILCIKKKYLNQLKEKYNFPNVSFVIHGSKDYFKAVACSEYLISDHYMLSNFCKRPEQKYLFTGTESMDPVLSYDKKIQFDMRHCLQADAILSFGCDYRKLILEQTYKLNPIYEQKIIEKSSGLSMKEFVHCVISIFFYQQDSPLILKFSSPKKKLLFWNNFSSSKELTFEFLDLLNALSTLDDQFYDVTVLVPYVPLQNKLILSSVHPSIRFFDFSGRMPFSREEYVEYLYLNQYLMHTDDVLSAIDSSHDYMEIWKRNLQRIWGNTMFDSFFYLGELKNDSFLLSCMCPAKSKNFIRTVSPKKEYRHFHVSKEREFFLNNRCSIYNTFNHIYFFNEVFLHEAIEFFPECHQNAVLVHRFPPSCKQTNCHHFIEKVKYENQFYYCLPLNRMSAQQPHVILFPIPSHEDYAILHVVTDSFLANYQQLITNFHNYQQNHPLSRFYIIDNYNIIDDITVKKLKLDNDSLITFLRYVPIIPSYISSFDGLMPETSKGSIKYHQLLSEEFNLPIIANEGSNGV